MSNRQMRVHLISSIVLEVKILPKLQQPGPLPVTNGVITPISRVITPVTPLFLAIYRGSHNSMYNWFSGAHLVSRNF